VVIELLGILLEKLMLLLLLRVHLRRQLLSYIRVIGKTYISIIHLSIIEIQRRDLILFIRELFYRIPEI
jgi:hypothetical protein